MGTVHARSLEPLPANGPDFGALGEEAEFVEVEPEAKQEILENKDVVVQHVHFDGLGRTKDDLIICEIGDVFKAKNLIEVMRKSHEAREKLLRLGIFRQVDVLIDTCQGDDALPNGLDVTFEVTELRRLTGSYNTMVGNNEGSMVLGLKLPNLLGRAEKVTFQFSYGTKETSYGLSFFKPRPGNFERNFSVNLYKVTGQFPWSSLRETDRGVSAEYSFPIWKTSHTVKWDGVWRELGCLSRAASFAVRKESGHSLKSSLSHAMVIDSRNSSIMPRRGALLKVNQELAGYTGGDVSFIKEDFELQLNKQLIFDSETTWAEKRTGPAACTCTPPCLSGQARAASENSSEHTSSSTRGISAISTTGRAPRLTFVSWLSASAGPTVPGSSSGSATSPGWNLIIVSPWACRRGTGYATVCSLVPGSGSCKLAASSRPLGRSPGTRWQ
ncbi:sorting and assembly machinery component 50 homolog isoform X2 [Felis catus]|uniref:sorting and assembly machinery component 50 homolog isoform X2 n=1 Tax=Felis catus TaxID=9685 RepID=UPI001D1A2A2D|nr:sorting and assembly machinery component 50 homolog isoform X2 [Felis catus]